MKRLRSFWRKLTYCLVGLIVLVFAGNIVLNRFIEQKIKTQLAQFSPYANIHIASAHANLFRLSLSLKELYIQYYPDTTDKQHAHIIQFKDAELSGINFIKVLFTKKIGISTVTLSSGTVTLNSMLLYKNLPQPDLFATMPFSNIDIGHINVTKGSVFLSAGTNTTQLLKGDLSIDDLKISHAGKTTISYGNVASSIQDVYYSIPGVQQVVRVKNLDMNSGRKTMHLDSISIMPGTVANNNNNVNTFIVKATIPAIDIKGIDIAKMQADNCIIGKVALDETTIHVDINSELQHLLQPLVKNMQRYIKSVNVGTVTLSNSAITATLNNVDTKKNYNNLLDSLMPENVTVNNIQFSKVRLALKGDENKQCIIDDLHIIGIKKTAGNKLDVESVEGSVSGISSSVPAMHGNMQIGRITLNTKKKLIQLENIKLVPQFDKYKLGNKLGKQADYVESSVSLVEINNLDIKELVNKKLQADKITVSNVVAYIFRDRRLPREEKVQLLPVEFLKTLPVQLNVKSLQVKNASVAYEEFPKDGKETGVLKVVNLNLLLSPLVNNASATSHINMHVEGSIMGSGTVSANVYMPMANDSEYHVEGEINNLSLTALNSSAENLGKFHIESGILNSLGFDFWLNNEKAHGKVIGEYHDLVLDKLKGEDKKVAWAPTFALKNLIIPKNKDKTMPVSRRSGIVRYDRDPTRFFSFYLVKSLLSGIRDSFTLGFLLPK